MNIIFILVTLLLYSCGFTKEEGNESKVLGVQKIVDKDLDGDLISNELEAELGLNSEVADLANLELRFNQNYNIDIQYKRAEEVKSFIVQESIRKDDSSAGYTYGKSLLSSRAFKESARIARFDGHSYGEVSDFDTDKYLYPLENEIYRNIGQLKFKKILENSEFLNAKLNIRANLFLGKHSLINEIRNPVFGVYYFNYKNRKYELLKEVKTDLILKENVLQEIDIELDNIPFQLIDENYFKKGELVLISIRDYEIPSLNTSYLNQLASIRQKSTTVSIFTPNSQKISYVASQSKKSFVEVLNKLHMDEFEVSENLLTKLGEFSNNLDGYENLSEVKDEYKKGKWFVYTNTLNQNFLSHKYSPDDFITLSYVTGHKLASQIEEKSRAYRNIISESSIDLLLGKITSRTKASFLISTGEIWGERIVKIVDTIRPGSCRGNCVPKDFACKISLNHFTGESFRAPFDMNISSNVFKLKVGEKLYNLNDLLLLGVIKKEKVEEFYSFSIIKPNHFFEEDEIGEKTVSLYSPTYKEFIPNGFKLDSMSGKTSSYDCPDILVKFAVSNNIPVSVESKDFNSWKHWFNWSKVKAGENKEEVLDFDFSITSSVTNYYN